MPLEMLFMTTSKIYYSPWEQYGALGNTRISIHFNCSFIQLKQQTSGHNNISLLGASLKLYWFCQFCYSSVCCGKHVHYTILAMIFWPSTGHFGPLILMSVFVTWSTNASGKCWIRWSGTKDMFAVLVCEKKKALWLIYATMNHTNHENCIPNIELSCTTSQSL